MENTQQKFTAEIKKYDPDFEEEATFPTRKEAADWLLEQRRYGLCSMWINGDRVRIHGNVVVNDEPEPLPAENTAMFGVLDQMVRTHDDFNRAFLPQPTRGMAPQNPKTPRKDGEAL